MQFNGRKEHIKEVNTKELLLEEIKNKHITFETEDDIESLGFGNLVDALYKKVAKNEKIIENTNGNEKIDLIGCEA